MRPRLFKVLVGAMLLVGTATVTTSFSPLGWLGLTTAAAQTPPQTPSDNANTVPPLPAPADDDDAATPAGAEVELRGPVHDAFAKPVEVNPEPGPTVQKRPPEPIEEVPPDEQPEGENIVWIPGYWAFDDDREDYLWVSGVLRAAPPGQTWVPGYWSEVAGGYQWTPGFWTSAAQDEVPYVAEAPPQAPEIGGIEPNSPSPSENHFWVPGTYVYRQNYVTQPYVWQPGYWTLCRPDWIWQPAHWVWTPGGYVFVNGFWDYEIERRGCLFAPVYFSQPLYAQASFVWTPRVVVNVGAFNDCWFTRPRYCHYYFGDYYAARYSNFGYRPWFNVNINVGARRGVRYDPLFTYYRWNRGRADRNWLARTQNRYELLARNEAARPPRTFVAQQQLLRANPKGFGNRPGDNLVMASTVKQAARDSGQNGIKFHQVSQNQQLELAAKGKELQNVARQRVALERKVDVGELPRRGPGGIDIAGGGVGKGGPGRGGPGKEGTEPGGAGGTGTDGATVNPAVVSKKLKLPTAASSKVKLAAETPGTGAGLGATAGQGKGLSTGDNATKGLGKGRTPGGNANGQIATDGGGANANNNARLNGNNDNVKGPTTPRTGRGNVGQVGGGAGGSGAGIGGTGSGAGGTGTDAGKAAITFDGKGRGAGTIDAKGKGADQSAKLNQPQITPRISQPNAAGQGVGPILNNPNNAIVGGGVRGGRGAGAGSGVTGGAGAGGASGGSGTTTNQGSTVINPRIIPRQGPQSGGTSAQVGGGATGGGAIGGGATGGGGPVIPRGSLPNTRVMPRNFGGGATGGGGVGGGGLGGGGLGGGGLGGGAVGGGGGAPTVRSQPRIMQPGGGGTGGAAGGGTPAAGRGAFRGNPPPKDSDKDKKKGSTNSPSPNLNIETAKPSLVDARDVLKSDREIRESTKTSPADEVARDIKSIGELDLDKIAGPNTGVDKQSKSKLNESLTQKSALPQSPNARLMTPPGNDSAGGLDPGGLATQNRTASVEKGAGRLGLATTNPAPNISGLAGAGPNSRAGKSPSLSNYDYQGMLERGRTLSQRVAGLKPSDTGSSGGGPAEPGDPLSSRRKDPVASVGLGSTSGRTMYGPLGTSGLSNDSSPSSSLGGSGSAELSRGPGSYITDTLPKMQRFDQRLERRSTTTPINDPSARTYDPARGR